MLCQSLIAVPFVTTLTLTASCRSALPVLATLSVDPLPELSKNPIPPRAGVPIAMVGRLKLSGTERYKKTGEGASGFLASGTFGDVSRA